MELTVLRKWFTEQNTIGELYVNGVFQCFTLEDCTREPGVKIPRETSVPYGRYEVTITYSNRFNRLLPLLADVPNFAGVRIHSGNTDKDTEGCILVGQTKAEDSVGSSRAAFNPLFEKLQAAEGQEEIFIEITKGDPNG